MSIRGVFKLAGLLAIAMVANPAAASQVLYDGTGFITGQQTFTDSFSVDGPGTLTVTLTDQAWPVALASLDLVISSPAGGLLGPEMGPGIAMFNVAQGGTVVAQWFGTAQGPLNAGTYGLEIQWTAITPVPLPTSIGLLLSGLAMLAWQKRRQGLQVSRRG